MVVLGAGTLGASWVGQWGSSLGPDFQAGVGVGSAHPLASGIAIVCGLLLLVSASNDRQQ